MARRARRNVLDPPETPGKDKEIGTGFATGSISFVNQRIPDPNSLRLPWRIRFYKADQDDSTQHRGNVVLRATGFVH